MISKEKTFFSFLWVIIERFSFSLILFTSTIILARLLTPYEFGLIGTVTIFVSLSSKIVESGFGAALVQKKEATIEDYSTIFVFNAVMSIFLYAILFFIAPIIADFYDNEIFTKIIRVLGLILIANAITLTQRIHLIRELEFKKQTLIKLISISISILVAITMAYNGYGVWALVTQLVLNSFLDSFFMWLTVRFKPLLTFNFVTFKTLFGFGGRIIMTSALQTVYEDIFGLIITKKFSAKLTGFYTQANKLVSFPTSIFGSLYDSAAFPILSKIDNPLDFKKMASNINKGIFSIALPILLVVPFQSENIVAIVLGENWIESSPILSILSISLVTSLISLSSHNMLKSLGKGKVMLRYGIIKICIGLIVLLITVFIDFKAIMFGIVFTNLTFSLIVFNKVSKITLYKWKDIFKDFFVLLIIMVSINIASTFIFYELNFESKIIELLSYVLSIFLLTFCYFFVFNRDVINSLVKIVKPKR